MASTWVAWTGGLDVERTACVLERPRRRLASPQRPASDPLDERAALGRAVAGVADQLNPSSRALQRLGRRFQVQTSRRPRLVRVIASVTRSPSSRQID